MKDLTGQRFGKLVAIRPVGTKSRRVLWECACDCGKLCEVTSDHLLSGHTTSCGCSRGRKAMHNLAGRQFGRLTAIRPVGNKNGYVVWECSCECGNTVRVRSDSLINEQTRSCGCLRKGLSARDLTGQRFGRLVAVKPMDSEYGYVMWECVCDCGNTVRVRSSSLTSGTTRSCGCLRASAVSPGDRFGKLEAIEATQKRQRGSVVWLCRCDCGREIEVSSANLKAGRKKSCGECDDE